MPKWKPSGHVAESPAKWEANPDRATYFLQLLADAMSDGKYKGTPTVCVYNEISKMFWGRFSIYHTPKQLKNFYANRKTFWTNVCWARERTGIGWDDAQKKIMASEEWWKAHEGRKGLSALKDRPIADYDLLDTVFAGQRANADMCYGPFQPIPLNTSEGSGDSDNPEDSTFFDPQTRPSLAEGSMNTSSGSKRPSQTRAQPATKRSKKAKSNPRGNCESPDTANMRHRFNVFFEVKETRRRMTFETEGARATSGIGSHPGSGSTINSNSNMDRCMRVLTGVLRLDANSDYFYHAVDMLVQDADLQSAFLGYPDPVSQLGWLDRKVRSKFPDIMRSPTPVSRYDLNLSPGSGNM